MLEEAIKSLPRQLEQELEVGNEEELQRYERFLVAGMGGSSLGVELLSLFRPSLDLVIHKDYGIPDLGEERMVDRLVIASSYSGNTEETIDAFERAREQHLPIAAISKGGKLLELAKKHDIPYVELPDLGLQPRSAVGLLFRALLKLVGDEELLGHTAALARQLQVEEYREKGKELADKLFHKIPVVYSSRRNLPLAFNWKLRLHEGAKVPVFVHSFPELNHEEMQGFERKELSERFHFVLLRDAGDHAKVKRRMDALENLWAKKGLPVASVQLEGPSELYKAFSCILLADWTVFFLSQLYGVDPEQETLIDEFKKLIS